MRLTLGQAAEVRLGRQRSPKDHEGDSMIPYLRSANVLDGALDLSDVKSMNFDLDEQTVFQLSRGDVLVTEGSGSRDTVGTSAVWNGEIDGPVCFQNTLLRLRPRHGVTDGRFLAWWARHARSSGQIAAMSTGANIFHLGAEGLRRLRLIVPCLDEQRQIADFLDHHVTGIDKVLGARRRQKRLLEAAAIAELEDIVSSPESVMRPLHTLTDPRRPIQYGIVLPGPDFPGGVQIIKGGDIGSGRMARLELNRTDPEIEARYARSRVNPGDYVVAIRGSVGEVDVVPPGLAVANLTQDSARIAPGSCHSAWLFAALRSSSVQSEMKRRMTGSSVQGINIDDLRRIPIPVPHERDQLEIAKRASHVLSERHEQRAFLVNSIELLTEYKTSLINAAVTGELDVTTAGSGIPA